ARAAAGRGAPPRCFVCRGGEAPSFFLGGGAARQVFGGGGGGPAFFSKPPTRHSHAIPDMPDARLRGDVCEAELAGRNQLVAEEPGAWRPRRRRRKLRLTHLFRRVQERALYKVDIQVPVAVIVKQGHACPHNFRHVEFAGRSIEMGKFQPHFRSHFPKDRGLREGRAWISIASGSERIFRISTASGSERIRKVEREEAGGKDRKEDCRAPLPL